MSAVEEYEQEPYIAFEDGTKYVEKDVTDAAIAELKAELQLFHDFLGTPITGHFDEKSISGRFKEMVALEVECYSIAYDENKRQITELKARIEELEQAIDDPAYWRKLHAKLAAAEARIEEQGNYKGWSMYAAEKQRADEAEAALATHLALCRQPKVKTKLVAELEETQAKLAAAEAERDKLWKHLDEVHHCNCQDVG